MLKRGFFGKKNDEKMIPLVSASTFVLPLFTLPSDADVNDPKTVKEVLDQLRDGGKIDYKNAAIQTIISSNFKKLHSNLTAMEREGITPNDPEGMFLYEKLFKAHNIIVFGDPEEQDEQDTINHRNDAAEVNRCIIS